MKHVLIVLLLCFSRIKIGAVDHFLTSLEVILDLPPVLSFASDPPMLSTTVANGAHENTQRCPHDQPRVGDRKAQKQGVDRTLMAKAKTRRSSLNRNFAPGRAAMTSPKDVSMLQILLANWRAQRPHLAESAERRDSTPQWGLGSTPSTSLIRPRSPGITYTQKQLLRRALSESDLTERAMPSTGDHGGSSENGSGSIFGILDGTYRKYYQDAMSYYLDYAKRSEDICDEHERQLAQIKERDIKRQVQYDSLHQKYYSGRKFATQRRIRLLVRVSKVPEDVNAATSPPLAEFDCSSTTTKISLTCRPTRNSSESASFPIDHYFGPSSINRDVYTEVEPLIDIVFHGYDVCVFTDGQSGSDKSWTMFKGPDAIAPSIAASVLAWKNGGDVHDKVSRNVKCSAVQIYQDQLQDLLITESGSGADTAAMWKAKAGCYDKDANSLEEFLSLFERARARLEIKATHENQESSRGHFFCSLILTQFTPSKPTVTSRITLIDLAGGERMSDPSCTFENKEKSFQPTGAKAKPSSSTAGTKGKPSRPSLAAETVSINSTRGELRTFLKERMNHQLGAAVSEVGNSRRYTLCCLRIDSLHDISSSSGKIIRE